MKKQINLINIIKKIDKKLKKIEYQLPFIKIPSFVPRTDNTNTNFFNSLLNTQIGKLYRNQEFVGINTLAASPHTLDMMEYQGNLIPSQFIIWWFENADSNPKRCNILDLSLKNQEQIKSCAEMISTQIIEAVRIMYEYHKDSIYQNLHIYGMMGHTDQATRDKYGLSRGCQSASDGHFHVTYISQNTIDKHAFYKIPTSDEILKHIGVFNELFYETNRDSITNLTRNITNEKTKFIRNIICDNRHLSFTQKINIHYSIPISIDQAIIEIINIVKIFSEIYEILMSGCLEYHISSKKIKEKIILSVVEKLLSFGINLSQNELIQIAKNLTKFALIFKPTYKQILHYQNNKNILRKIHKQKSKLIKNLEKIAQNLIKKHQLSPILAECYVKLISERFLDDKPANNIHSGTFAVAIEFRDVSIKNNQIFVKNLNLYPRFGTSKGVLEDEKGVIFGR